MSCFTYPPVVPFQHKQLSLIPQRNQRLSRQSVVRPRRVPQKSFGGFPARICCVVHPLPWEDGDFWNLSRKYQVMLLDQRAERERAERERAEAERERAEAELKYIEERYEESQRQVARLSSRSVVEDVLDRRYPGGIDGFKRSIHNDKSLKLPLRDKFFRYLLEETPLNYTLLPKLHKCDPENLPDVASVSNQLVALHTYLSRNIIHTLEDADKLLMMYAKTKGVKGISPVDKCLVSALVSSLGYGLEMDEGLIEDECEETSEDNGEEETD
eukprot:CAMPEP_0184652604 /NCGR_PEP_ID=MMETSP0308-20130426/10304_1 /TAXON_ID=38269 /ORGANISM="Gloeochaete witrockiana, Strain SAG 46.84" /LENGTH=270 /DNA_ID=CAMNT_0027087583 /DNA_START=72 /DNA_END=884 /DNA_ORIENTATION=-